MGVQVIPDPVAEDRRTDMLFQHAQHRRTLFIGQHVEHRVGVLGGLHRILDRSGALQSVYGIGRSAGDTETVPAFPLRLPGINGHHFHEGGEGFIQPEPVPPRHGHQIPEPHMRIFMSNDIGDSLQLSMRGALLINQQGSFTVRNGAQVFHGPGGKVRNGQQIQLVSGIGDSIIFLKK